MGCAGRRRGGGSRPGSGWTRRRRAVGSARSAGSIRAGRRVWKYRSARVSAAGHRQLLVCAASAATGGVKYFVSNAVGRSPRTVLRAGFRRAPVEHLFRLAEGEAGLTHFEGRSYRGPVRHTVPAVAVMAFASMRAAEGPKKSGSPTVEQVCRAVDALVGRRMRRFRCTTETAAAEADIAYRQARNGSARRSRVKYRERIIQNLIAL